MWSLSSGSNSERSIRARLLQKGSRPLTSIISVATARLDVSSNAFSLHEPMRWGRTIH